MTVQAIASQTSSDYLFWDVPVALSTNALVDSASLDRAKCSFTSDVGASFATGTISYKDSSQALQNRARTNLG